MQSLEGVPLRLGLIGAGRWGRVLVRVIRETPDLDLVWLASHASDARSLVPAGATVVEDWRALVSAAADLDGIVIATAAAAHGAPLRVALECGVPAFVEKPLTTNLDEAEALVALQAATGVPVVVDHTALFDPAYARLRESVRRADVRVVASVGGQWGRRGGDVGALWDYGPHDVALCLDLLGLDARLEEARRIESGVIDGQDCEVIRLTLVRPDGARATATFGNHMEPKRRWFAVDDGTQVLAVDGQAEPSLRRLPAGAPLAPASTRSGDPIAVGTARPLDRAFAHFAAAIRDGWAVPSPDLLLGLAVVRVLAAAEAMLSS